MSATVEAAAKALRADTMICHMDGSVVPFEQLATETLAATLSHLTEGLAEVISSSTYQAAWGECERAATAITEELKRRIEG